MIRLATCVLAFMGIVMFPWPVAVILSFIAAVFLPPLALLFGVLYDVLYFAPGAYPVPLGTILGLIGFALTLGVHGFMKTRIMGA